MSINVLDIKDLETFIHAVENLSLTVTSKKLGVDQSTVTKRINNVENKVNGKLFNRKSRPLELTHLGKKVYTKGRYILDQLEQLESFHKQDAITVPLKLKVGIPITLVDDLSEYVNERYKYDHYLKEIDIYSGWGRSLIQQVEGNELELAIVMIPSNLSLSGNLFFSNLGTLPLRVVSKKNGVKEYNNLEKCIKKGWVVHPEGCCFRESLSKKLDENDLSFYVNKEVFGIEHQLNSVLEGDGLGVFPEPFVKHYTKSNAGVEIVSINDFNIHLNVGVVYSEQTDLDVVQYFSKIVKERYFVDKRYN